MIDNKAEKYYSVSQYIYALNNPIVFLDPDGNDVVYFDNQGTEITRIQSDSRFETYHSVAEGTAGAVNCEISPIAGSFRQDQMPGVIAGYEDPKYQQLDYQIAATTGIMNDNLASKTDLPATDNHQFTADSKTPTLDVNLVKSLVMEESKMGTVSGGSGTGKTDPMQANNKGDWSSDKSAVGLSKGQQMDPKTSINAGVGILVLKGMNSDTKGNYTTWKGDKAAVAKYNGGGNPNYVSDVFKSLSSIKPAKKENYVTR